MTPVFGSGLDSLARISWREISRTSSSVSHGAVTAAPAWYAAAAARRARARMRGRTARRRTVPPVAGQRQPDQPRVLGAQLVLAEAEPLGHAGPPVVHDDVGAGDQLAGDALALWLLEVEADRPLARGGLHRRCAPGDEMAVRVAVDRLDLDDIAPRGRRASIAAVGPAMIVANSTTVMPSSGRPGGGAVADGGDVLTRPPVGEHGRGVLADARRRPADCTRRRRSARRSDRRCAPRRPPGRRR